MKDNYNFLFYRHRKRCKLNTENVKPVAALMGLNPHRFLSLKVRLNNTTWYCIAFCRTLVIRFAAFFTILACSLTYCLFKLAYNPNFESPLYCTPPQATENCWEFGWGGTCVKKFKFKNNIINDKHDYV